MPRLQAGLDLATSSSVSEAFPLAIGEAMACGVPCVATDVGDSASIVGETGRVVPPRDPRALAAAWEELLALAPDARRRLGQAARLRVQERYGLAAITRRYEDLYETLCAGGLRSTARSSPAPARRRAMRRRGPEPVLVPPRRIPVSNHLSLVPGFTPRPPGRRARPRADHPPVDGRVPGGRSARERSGDQGADDHSRPAGVARGATSSTCPRGSSSGAATST